MTGLYDWIRSTYRRFENPLLMKELRQAVRSRIYVYAFMTILFICFFIMSLFLLVEKGEGGLSGGSVGQTSFLILFVPFYIVALFGIPMTAFLSQLYEVEQDCLELVQVTNLTTGQIIRGKIYAAAVKLVLFLTALIPFFAFCYLLRGISIVAIVVPLVVTILLSTLLVTIYVFFSMLVQTGFSKVLSMLFVVGISGSVGSSMYGLGYGALFHSYGLRLFHSSVGSGGFWAVTGAITLVLAVWGALVFLFHQASLAMAMKSTKNHTWPVRFAFLVLMVVLLSIPFVISPFGSFEVSTMFGILSFYLWPLFVILALVWVTEEDRIPRTVAESKHWYMSVPYLSRLTLPGGVWGYHFTVMCCLFIICLGCVAYSMDQPFSSDYRGDRAKLMYQSQYIIAGYLLMYAGLAHYLAKTLRSFWPHMRLRTIRGIVLVGVVVVMVGPVMVLGFAGSMTHVDVLNVFTMFNPFFMFEQVEDNNQWVPYFLLIAGLGISLWVSTFFTGRKILRESNLQEI